MALAPRKRLAVTKGRPSDSLRAQRPNVRTMNASPSEKIMLATASAAGLLPAMGSCPPLTAGRIVTPSQTPLERATSQPGAHRLVAASGFAGVSSASTRRSNYESDGTAPMPRTNEAAHPARTRSPLSRDRESRCRPRASTRSGRRSPLGTPAAPPRTGRPGCGRGSGTPPADNPRTHPTPPAAARRTCPSARTTGSGRCRLRRRGPPLPSSIGRQSSEVDVFGEQRAKLVGIPV